MEKKLADGKKLIGPRVLVIYGDVVLNGRMRLLAPLQAANGLMMFGITTAIFIATVHHATAKWIAAHRALTHLLPDLAPRPFSA